MKYIDKDIKDDAGRKWVSVVRLQMVREKESVFGLGKITGSEGAVQTVRSLFEKQDREIMAVLSLSVRMIPLAMEVVAVGGLNACAIDVPNIFKHAILANASAIICFHFHPSGDPSPSEEDEEATERLRKAGDILGISLVDHIIIAGEGIYYSFAEHHRGGL